MATFTNQATLSYNGGTTTSNITTGELVEILSATKTTPDGSYTTGEPVTFVLSMENTGTTPVTGVSVSDNLGAYTFGTGTVYPLEYVPGSLLLLINGTLQPTPTVTSGPPLVISGFSIPAGGNASIIYDALPTSYAPLGTGQSITNTATITGTGIANSILASTTVPAATTAALAITKAMNPTTVSENGTLTYTFTITNTGPSAITATDNTVFTDTFQPVLNPITVTYNGVTWPDTNYTYNTTTGNFTSTAGSITVPGATYTQDPSTGQWTVTPGTATLVISGTV